MLNIEFLKLFSDNNGQVLFLYRISYIWYSALGCLITVIMGLFASFGTGAQDPHEIDWELLSPPIRNLFFSMSNRSKEFFNIPLKLQQKNTKNLQNIALKGVSNLALDVTDEKDIEQEKVRKLSAPPHLICP